MDSGDRSEGNNGTDETCKCAKPDVWDLPDGPSCIGCGLPLSFPGQNEYTYAPLKHSDEIRLVRLLPSWDRECDVRCIITHTKLSEDMGFEALSYVWGSNLLSEQIETQNGSIQITGNCLDALLDLRRRHTSRLLWIDAICINQRNNEEKNHQVPLMSRIYATASQTLIYLGPQRTDKVLALFKELDRYWSGELSLNGLTEDYWRDVRELISMPWFRRVWVLQELANSKKALLFWGSTFVTWNVFSDAVRRLYSSRNYSLPPALRMKDSDPKPFYELLDLINCATFTHSSDPRDKVYALIGLLKTTVLHGIVPDYNKSVVDVNVDLIHSFVRLHNNLTILLFSVDKPKPVITDGGDSPKDLATDRDSEQSLPTWVPDLRYRHQRSSSETISYHRTSQYDSFEGKVALPCTSEFHSHRGPALKVSLLRYSDVATYVMRLFNSMLPVHTAGTGSFSYLQNQLKIHHIQATDEVCLINGFQELLVLRAVEHQHGVQFYQLITETEEITNRPDDGMDDTRAQLEKNKPVIPDPRTGRPISWEIACLI